MSKTLPNKSPKSPQQKENYLKLLSIITHNVKGPVRHMEYITDYTLRNWGKMQPADLLDCAKVINESARNITEQLGNILSWARLQDGTFEPNLKTYFLQDLLADELRLQRPILKMKELKLVQHINKKLEIQTDGNLLKLAIHNILSNAIKFTGKNGQITITEICEKDRILILFKDSGRGMTPEELDMVSKEQSFSTSGTINEQGTGFGLRISKEILALLNGGLEVESEYGVGTTITLFIPR